MMRERGRSTLIGSRLDSSGDGLWARKGTFGMDEHDELGPVDYLVVEFPPGAANFTGEMAAELLLRRIATPQLPADQRIVTPSIVLRESTAPLAGVFASNR